MRKPCVQNQWRYITVVSFDDLKNLFTIFWFQYVIHSLRAPAETSLKQCLEFEFFIKGDEHYKI